VRIGEGKIVLDKHRQAKLRHGELEIRFECEPFPLYPGEKLSGPVQPLVVVAENTALRLKARKFSLISARLCECRDVTYRGSPHATLRPVCDFDDAKGQGEDKGKEKLGKPIPVRRIAGEEWLFAGPHTYYPRVEVAVMEVIHAVVLKPDQALHLRYASPSTASTLSLPTKLTSECAHRAYRDFVDRQGVERKAGEEWLVRTAGAFLPDVNEKLVATISGYILTSDRALHLRARTSFTDVYVHQVCRVRSRVRVSHLLAIWTQLRQ
jgi:major vault protein